MSVAYTNMSYRDVAPDYNEINFIPDHAALEFGKSVAALLPEAATILDMGCGAGRVTVPLAVAGLSTTGLDLEPNMLEAAKERAASMGVEGDWVAGSVTDLPFENDTYDGVITTSVFHLVTEWRTALREAARVLKPEGIFIIGRNVLDDESCQGRIRKKLRDIAAQADESVRPTDAAGPALFTEISKLGGELGRPIEGTSWQIVTSPARELEKIKTRRHNESWALSDKTHNIVVDAITPWISSEFSDMDKEETVDWRFMIYPIRGLS